MRIFYSWQSDTPPKTGRYLLRDALKVAIKEITADLELEEADRPELDHDTKGILGAPDISQAILEKIDLADIVVTDVTLVGKTPAGKKLINSNVAIELGYALKSKGYEALLVIVNTEYGEDKELPFDLRNRRLSVLYSLPPDADRAERKKALDNLVKKIKPILEAYIKQPKIKLGQDAPAEFSVAETTISPAHFFQQGATLVGANPEYDWPALKCKTSSLIYVRVRPKYAATKLTERETFQIAQDDTFQPLRIGDGHSRDRNLNGTIVYASNKKEGEILSATQLFRSREIWGFDASLLGSTREKERYKDVIPGMTLKEIIVHGVRRYIDAAERLLGYDPPIIVEVGASNVSGLSIGANTQWTGPFGPIHRQHIQKVCELADFGDDNVNRCLKEVFEEFFDAVGAEIPAEFLAFQPHVDW